MTPHPPRPLTRLNCACLQDLEDIFRVFEHVCELWVWGFASAVTAVQNELDEYSQPGSQ